MISVLVVDGHLQDGVDVLHVAAAAQEMIGISIFYCRSEIEMQKNLQGEDFLPARRQRLVLGLRLQSCVDQLEHAKGVALAAQVGRRQALSPEHFDG